MIESLAGLESAVMEECLMMLLKVKPSVALLKIIIEWIAEDERRHAQILETLKSR